MYSKTIWTCNNNYHNGRFVEICNTKRFNQSLSSAINWIDHLINRLTKLWTSWPFNEGQMSLPKSLTFLTLNEHFSCMITIESERWNLFLIAPVVLSHWFLPAKLLIESIKYWKQHFNYAPVTFLPLVARKCLFVLVSLFNHIHYNSIELFISQIEMLNPLTTCWRRMLTEQVSETEINLKCVSSINASQMISFFLF